MSQSKQTVLQDLFREMENPHYKVALVLDAQYADPRNPSGRKVIDGFVVDDLAIRFDSNYGSLSQIFDTQQLNVLGGAFQGLIPNWDRQYAIVTFYSSIQYWTGYSHFELQLELLYPVLDEKSYQRYKRNIETIVSSVVPDMSSSTFIVVAPNEYDPTTVGGLRTHPKGTWFLAIGDWFRAPGLLITSANIGFSRQAVHPIPKSPKSVPLVARVSLSLRSWRLYTEEEVRSLFRL